MTISEQSKNSGRTPPGKSNNRVRVPKVSELIAAELRRRIVAGELREGENLAPEAELIEEFGISRPTMREAIRILEAERLISISRGARRGATVHLPDIDLVTRYAGVYLQSHSVTIEEIFEARIMLEPTAAAMAAEQRPSGLIEHLYALVSELEASVQDGEVFAHVNTRFHAALFDGSGNEALSLMGRMLMLILEEHFKGIGDLFTTETALVGVRSARRLVELIESGDSEAARAHLCDHLDSSKDILLQRCGRGASVELLG